MASTCKYYKQQKQVSYDGGVTWQNVVPAEYQKGELYEERSVDCGYQTITRWVYVGDKCESGDLYKVEMEEISYDDGVNWTRTGNERDTLKESHSSACGDPPPPEGCQKFIVDGGHWDNAPATGASTCDSAFLYVEGTPVFTPATASTWVTINFYHWDEDPASTMCTDYSAYPCEANSLMRAAGLVDNDMHCSDIPTPTYDDMPPIVQQAVNKESGSYAHALGTVTYTLAANNGDPRNCTIQWYVDSTECMSEEFTISQLGTGSGCDCDNFRVTGSQVTVPATTSSTEYAIGNYTGATGCAADIHVGGLNNGSDFLGSFRFSNGTIYAKVKAANTSTSTRIAQYTIEQNNCKGYVNVTQAAAPVPTDNKFEWNWQGHETSYSTTVGGNDTYIQLIQFTSRLNGVEVNAVLSSPAAWIITNSPSYINNNELAPNVNNTLYIQPNTGNASRTGTLTLTQKGTNNTITLFITQGAYEPDCTIKSFTIDSEVCKGTAVTYSYDVVDTRCTSTQYFSLYDSDGHNIESTSTPSGGHGTGTFATTNASLGGGSVTVTVNGVVKNYNVLIKDCSQPSNISVDFQFINNSGMEIYWDYVDFYGSGGGAPLSLSFGQDVIMVGAIKTRTKELSYSLENWQFNTIKLRDTFAMHRTMTCLFDGNKFVDGGIIKIYITGVE